MSNTQSIFFHDFIRLISAGYASRNNFRNFCKNIDTTLDTNITELVEVQFSLMDMLLEMNLTNIENGNKPMKLKCGMSYFEEELDKILED